MWCDGAGRDHDIDGQIKPDGCISTIAMVVIMIIIRSKVDTALVMHEDPFYDMNDDQHDDGSDFGDGKEILHWKECNTWNIEMIIMVLTLALGPGAGSEW